MRSPGQEEEIALEKILELGRRRAFFRDCMIGVARGGVWGSVPAGLVIWFRGESGISGPVVLILWAVIAFLVGFIFVWSTRSWRDSYARQLDDHVEAGDCIASAAEFLADAESDPFKRLAVQEAESVLARSGKVCVGRRWPMDAMLIPVAVLALAVLFVFAG